MDQAFLYALMTTGIQTTGSSLSQFSFFYAVFSLQRATLISEQQFTTSLHFVNFHITSPFIVLSEGMQQIKQH